MHPLYLSGRKLTASVILKEDIILPTDFFFFHTYGSALLEYDTVQVGRQIPTFLKCLFPSRQLRMDFSAIFSRHFYLSTKFTVPKPKEFNINFPNSENLKSKVFKLQICLADSHMH